MIKIENVETYGWEAAVRGMRNPMNSWDKSDSKLVCVGEEISFLVGENDLTLMKNLSKAGTDHSKYLRMIQVSIDITAPLYWWKEYDTYKVGTVRNSCSTMHKIHSKEFTFDDFSIDHIYIRNIRILKLIIKTLNAARKNYLKTKDKDDWWQMIQLLPSSYNQKATCTLNYEVLKNMYHARKSHKLDEWRYFCEWIESLPYAKELIVGEE